MINLYKRNLPVILAGFAVGVGLLLVNIAISLFSGSQMSETVYDELRIEAQEVSVNKVALNSELLKLFDIEHIDQTKIEGSDDLLPNLSNYIVKIIAQSKINGFSSTVLEVSSDSKTVKAKAEAGKHINGLLIKQVEVKQIVIEKDNKEYVVKLFHKRKLN